MNYMQRALELKDELVANRRWLHQNPEVGLDLRGTTDFVRARLLEAGIEAAPCGKGLTALIGGKRPGKVILLRADMDALPMWEESGLNFASRKEAAHACGHDMHTAMLLCAARMLKEQEDSLPGTVKLMFQPGEEILEGARNMIAAGLLENPAVDAALGAHVMPMVPTGFIGYNTGVASSSSDTLSISIQGKGGHGAMPSRTVDPINVGAHIHLALQELISREVDSAEAVALTIGSFHAGHAHNIIPDTALLQGTLRTFHEEVRSFMLQRIREVCSLTAQTFRADARVSVLASTPSMVVNEPLAECVAASLRELLGNSGVRKLEQRMSGSEDFAEVAAQVPAMFFIVGAGSEEEGCRYELHNPRVVFHEGAMPVGAAAYAQAAHGWLSSHSE